jgi:hypothetical protein
MGYIEDMMSALKTSEPQQPQVDLGNLQQAVAQNPFGYKDNSALVQGMVQSNAQRAQSLDQLYNQFGQEQKPNILDALTRIAGGVQFALQAKNDPQAANANLANVLGGVQKNVMERQQKRQGQFAMALQRLKDRATLDKQNFDMMSGLNEDQNKNITNTMTGIKGQEDVANAQYGKSVDMYGHKVSLAKELLTNAREAGKAPDLSKMMDAKAYDYYNTNSGRYRDAKTGEFDSERFLSDTRKYQPELYPAVQKMLGIEVVDPTTDVMKRVSKQIEDEITTNGGINIGTAQKPQIITRDNPAFSSFFKQRVLQLKSEQAMIAGQDVGAGQTGPLSPADQKLIDTFKKSQEKHGWLSSQPGVGPQDQIQVPSDLLQILNMGREDQRSGVGQYPASFPLGL